VADAARGLNSKKDAIYRAIRKLNNSAVGFCWCYPHELETFISKVKNKEDLISNFQKTYKVKIIDYDGIEHYFDSATKAANHFKCNVSFISMLLSGIRKSKKIFLIERI